MRTEVAGELELPEREDRSSWDPEFLNQYAKAYPRLLAIVISIVGNSGDAEDVMQNVSIRLWEKYEQFEPGTSFLRWASAFAVNMSKEFYRDRRLHRGYGLSELSLTKLAQCQSGGSELLELRRQQLKTCLKKMSRADRQLIAECYGNDQKIINIARQLNRPASSVYTKLRRLRQQLFECINRTLGLDQEEVL